MITFIPAHISCLESHVQSYAAAGAINRLDVEELMSIFMSLSAELEKSLARDWVSPEALQSALADFKRLASIGGRIRTMATSLRKEGHIVTGLDPFVRSVIRCRDIARSDEVAPEYDPRPSQNAMLQQEDEAASIASELAKAAPAE